MKHKTGKVIMGATLSLAAIAIAIDHTEHKLPEVESMSSEQDQEIMESGTPCSLGAAPCALGADGTEESDDE